jgi:hypothetical protein
VGRGSDRGRKDACLDEVRAGCNAERFIDSQHIDGDAPDWGKAMENRAVPAEMPAPLMTAGIEKWSQLTGARIQAGKVRALVRIASDAAQGEIARDGRPAVLPRDDMVHLKRGFVVILRHLAVFAATECPLPDLPGESCIHIAPHEAGRFFRSIPRARQALIWSSESRPPALP